MGSLKPTVVIGNCELYLGDCREILSLLPKVDAVVTDPPYGIKRDGKPKSTSTHGGHKGYAFKGWDTSPPDVGTIKLIMQISRHQIIWGANYFPHLLPGSMGWLVWDKGQRISQSDGELAFTNLPKALRIFTLNRTAIASDGAVHPTQKPLPLMKWCLTHIPNAETILDPFMGSGTTGVACIKMGRKFTGVEIDPDYFKIACERIQQAYDQPDMFVKDTTNAYLREVGKDG